MKHFLTFYYLLLSIIIFLNLCSLPINGESPIDVQNHIKELRKELFKNRGYDVMARPVKNYTHPVNVSIYLDINYIKNLDVQNNLLESVGWIRLSWVDENLKWKTTEFGGIEDIRVNVDEVFRPDITIINSADSENVIKKTSHSDLILWFTGEIFWMPALSMKTLCDVDLTEWPFDEQTCLYRFASWTYDGNALDLQNISDKIDLTSFSENSEWEVVDSSCEYQVHGLGLVEEVFYPEVTFALKVRRRTTIYRYVVYFPVISVLLLNLMALFLDVRNKLRFHLSTLSFITILLVSLYLGSKLGFGSLGIPKIIRYLGHMIVLVAATLLWFAFSLNFIKSSYEMPSIIFRLIEPVQHLLVRTDIESMQLTNNGDPENPSTLATTTTNIKKSNVSQSNLILVQVIDKLLFIIFLLLIIFLRN